MKKIIAAVMSIAACSLIFASCSNKNETSSNESRAKDTTATSSAANTSRNTITTSKATDNSRNDSREGNLGDDVADVIDDGLSTAEDVVDDILR
ncbi:hypothetical protein [Ruminococcus sp. Marseille-P6503]|uniref:hypothetical protein n=1 Tax=Ruminococcus sp. Marseille-P6503 TaxID=2364796 RepID=UPI000F53FB3F|nr:hypothetical protein [Ruminococcus sp. Marseille-P6503]